MIRQFGLGVALALVLAVPGAARTSPGGGPADVAAAVAAPGRSADNMKLDASRRPAEVLRFLGLRKGMRVADMFGGNRYWAEIFSQAVGPTGHVTVWEPTQFYKEKTKAELTAFAASHPNVSILTSPFEAPDLPSRAFDFMLINLDYHDTYWQSEKNGIVRQDPGAWLTRIRAAMKPGGIVGVVDHVGPAGDTRAIVEKLHRIDPAVVRADFRRAGFVLDGTSDLLRNPADDHSLLVFDPTIRGKTDRFVYRFKKPR
ncbi:MAG: class I SAM-dependent methyltransferase [Sphingomicrobium sp.]|nr:methyltransferase [Sphingomonadales bacterium]